MSANCKERTPRAATGQHEGSVLLHSPALENQKRQSLLGKTKVIPFIGVEVGEEGKKANSSYFQILPILGPQSPLGVNLHNATQLT